MKDYSIYRGVVLICTVGAVVTLAYGVLTIDAAMKARRAQAATQSVWQVKEFKSVMEASSFMAGLPENRQAEARFVSMCHQPAFGVVKCNVSLVYRDAP